MNLRIKAGVDHFHDVGSMPHKDIALLARSLEIDIAVDLAGLTAKSKTDIFAMSVAPIQMSYIGYLGTMGADYYDYLIADPDYKKENRSEIITLLIDKTVEKCFKQGAEGVWCTTPYDKVLNKLKELNYIISKEKHNIIYKTK